MNWVATPSIATVQRAGEVQWKAWLHAHNRKGTRLALWIGVIVIPTFGLFDLWVAPAERLHAIWGTRAVVSLLSILALALARTQLFERYPNAFICTATSINGCGLSLIEFAAGGFSPHYYAGPVFTILNVSLILLFPLRVGLLAFGLIIGSYILPNLPGATPQQLAIGASNSLLLIAAAVFALIGQTLRFASSREQAFARVRLESMQQSAEAARRQIEEKNSELNQAYSALKDLDRAKTEFFANISHELRTPLTVLLSALRLLRRQHSPPDAERGLRNAARLLQLVNDLLDLSKLDHQRALQKRPCNVAELVKHVCANFEGSEGLSRISVQGAEDVVLAEVDPRLLKTALYNLLSNAFKFSDSENFPVKVRLGRKEDLFEISVQDQGIGIPEDAREQIFERFTQVDSSATRRFEGTGIGLSLVKEIVSAHGGEVMLQSVVGEGSTFTLRLPVGELEGQAPLQEDFNDLRDEPWRKHHSNPAPSAQEAELRHPLEATSGEDKPLVLVAEDNADLRDYVVRVLSSQFHVMAARDGREALERARSRIPELIVSDRMMPRMSGDQLLEAVRADAVLRGVPLMFLTARSELDAQVDGLKNGANDYLTKPFHEDELVARASNLVRLHRQEQEIRALVHRLERANAELAELSRTDGLTGIANRRAFEERLLAEWRGLCVHQDVLSIVLCDVDCFKSYNDSLGHVQGDECLRQVSAAMAKSLSRRSDLLARYGGEEFVVILPQTDASGAIQVAERLREAVLALALPHPKSSAGRFVSVSVGAATLRASPENSPFRCVELADEVLYVAKREGRNRSIHFDAIG